MSIKHMEEYRDPHISKGIIDNIKQASKKPVRLMEVCGTHTMSIFRSGIRSLLPDTISLLSGPGCPVCVTAQNEIDTFIELAKIDNMIVTTFGDLMRVPGTFSSLQKEHANGRDIRIVYSSMDALDIAKTNPDKHVVFLGVGFETTAPTIAASIYTAKQMNVCNFFVCSAHKLVPPALIALLETEKTAIDGFILPGHVSVIIGTDAYLFVLEHYQIPCVVAGFEPADILHAISMLVKQIETGNPSLENAYMRAVTPAGNKKAIELMNTVFDTVDATWRGIGIIPASGLKIGKDFSDHDAEHVFDINVPESREPRGCACGDILTGIKIPPECALFKKVCTPEDPVGPCMVSSEGSCAAFYKYQ
ncbi:MAG: hydrogenase formation protein HypD [Deltaproteobacteria bacterium]|nr:hydrogenase formation protein HypD [Deltaproteobacteria bacterium]